jgi:hypothetical protein
MPANIKCVCFLAILGTLELMILLGYTIILVVVTILSKLEDFKSTIKLNWRN